MLVLGDLVGDDTRLDSLRPLDEEIVAHKATHLTHVPIGCLECGAEYAAGSPSIRPLVSRTLLGDH